MTITFSPGSLGPRGDYAFEWSYLIYGYLLHTAHGTRIYDSRDEALYHTLSAPQVRLSEPDFTQFVTTQLDAQQIRPLTAELAVQEILVHGWFCSHSPDWVMHRFFEVQLPELGLDFMPVSARR